MSSVEETRKQNSLEKTSTMTAKVVKRIVVVVLSLVALTAVFWLLFYSVYTANLPFVFRLRDWYQHSYWDIKTLVAPNIGSGGLSDAIYTFQVRGQYRGINFYSFRGRFVSLNSVDKTVTLADKNGKTYVFSCGDNEIIIGQDGKLEFDTAYTFTSIPAPDGLTRVNNIHSDDIPLTQDSKIIIYWDDRRGLPQLLNDHKADPQRPVNSESKWVFDFNKIG